jgi:hypothetical protein
MGRVWRRGRDVCKQWGACGLDSIRINDSNNPHKMTRDVINAVSIVCTTLPRNSRSYSLAARALPSAVQAPGRARSLHGTTFRSREVGRPGASAEQVVQVLSAVSAINPSPRFPRYSQRPKTTDEVGGSCGSGRAYHSPAASHWPGRRVRPRDWPGPCKWLLSYIAPLPRPGAGIIGSGSGGRIFTRPARTGGGGR